MTSAEYKQIVDKSKGIKNEPFDLEGLRDEPEPAESSEIPQATVDESEATADPATARHVAMFESDVYARRPIDLHEAAVRFGLAQISDGYQLRPPVQRGAAWVADARVDARATGECGEPEPIRWAARFRFWADPRT